jgi:hypothetical protein
MLVATSARLAFIFLAAGICRPGVLEAQQIATPESHGSAGDPASSILPKRDPAAIWSPRQDGSGIDWKGVINGSLLFLGVEHGYRLATEPGTREGLKGPYLRNYLDAITNLHGWGDGDPFYVNYIGHPMQGAVAAYIWAQNDRDYRTATFGSDRRYWKSRLRAAAFAFVYSSQIEVGPVSEASIGAIQKYYPQQGFVDHVITPIVGTGWMLSEDALDKFVITPLERRYRNPWLLMAVRGGLNPSRSFANAMRLKVPWARDDRPGLFSHGVLQDYLRAKRDWPDGGTIAGPSKLREGVGLDSVEITGSARTTSMPGSHHHGLCLGGGAEVAARTGRHWQFVSQLYGCNLDNIEPDRSGDELTFLAGMRWTPAATSRWSPFAQILIGATKITEEQIYPKLRDFYLNNPKFAGVSQDELYHKYATQYVASAGTVAGGVGLDFRLHPALAVRVASLEYRHAFLHPIQGRDYNEGFSISTGLVMRMGSW